MRRSNIRKRKPRNEPQIRMVSLSVPFEEFPQQESDIAIVCVAGGDRCNEESHVTASLMRSYSERCGADFILLTGDHCPSWPMGNKYRIFPLLSRYEMTLYLDTDVVVMPDSPSIFEVCSGYDFAAVDEYPWVHANYGEGWVNFERNAFCQSQGLTCPPDEIMWNGGVMMFTKASAECYRPPEFPFPDQWCSDQHLVTVNTMKKNCLSLGAEWNYPYISKFFWEKEIESAFFVHTNGAKPHGYRIELLRRLSQRNFERFYPPDGHWRPNWTLNNA